MLLNINFFFYFFFSFLIFNNSFSQDFKYFDKIFNLFKDNNHNNITIAKNIFGSDDNMNIIVIDNEYFDIIENTYSNDLNFYEDKIYNTLYYIEFNDLTIDKETLLPLVFAESYNKNWQIINLKQPSEKINHINHFLNYFKLKANLNSNYKFIDYSHYKVNNYSNLFLINYDEDISNFFLIYYKKSFVIQLFWLILFLISPILIYITLYLGIKKPLK